MEDNWDPGQPESAGAPIDDGMSELSVTIRVDRVLRAALDQALPEFTILGVPSGQAWHMFLFSGSESEGWTRLGGSVIVRHGTQFAWQVPRDFHGCAVVLENQFGGPFIPNPVVPTDDRSRGRKDFRIDYQKRPPAENEYAVYES